MNLLERLIAKTNTVKKTLVLPEGHDPRVMAAAAKIAKKGIAAKVIVLATPAEAKESMDKANVSFDGLNVEVMDHLANKPLAEKLAAHLFERRKAKGMKDMAEAVMLGCIEKGFLVNKLKPNAVRMIPPLIITKKDVDEATGILQEVLAKQSG